MSTETVTPESVTETDETTKAVPDLSELGEEDDLTAIVVKRAGKAKAELDKVAATLNTAGDTAQLLQDALKNSENSEVQALMARIDKANEAIINWTKAAEELVKPTLNVPSEEQVKAHEETYKSLVSQIKTFDTVFVNEVKANYPDLTIYDYIGDLPKAKRSGATGAKAGQGEGTSRPRVSEVAVSTDNGETYTKVTNKDGKSTFSVLTQWLKKETGESVGATDLHEAWSEQNGNKAWNDMPEQSTFNYSLSDANGKVHSFFVRVTR